MKLAFIQGGSRWKIDNEGNYYTDANLNEEIWNRYIRFCDSMIGILRREEQIYTKQEAAAKFNYFDKKRFESCHIPDIYRPKKNFFSLSKQFEVRRKIQKVIGGVDFVIVREPGNLYSNEAIKAARKYKIPYLIEVTSDVFGVFWSWGGVIGKIRALVSNQKCKSIIRHAPYVIYVTQHYLQGRYPTNGKSIGCSDADIQLLSEDEFSEQLEKVNKDKKTLKIGTAAYLNVTYKGQGDVIRVLAELAKKGIDGFEYHLLGSGDSGNLVRLAEHLGLREKVIIDGAVPHEQVSQWLDTLDIYIQPSYQEGLCRAIIEAIARGCPTICTNVGGNSELIPTQDMYQAGDLEQLEDLLLSFRDRQRRVKASIAGYKVAQNFTREVLDRKRDQMLNLFFDKR